MATAKVQTINVSTLTKDITIPATTKYTQIYLKGLNNFGDLTFEGATEQQSNTNDLKIIIYNGHKVILKDYFAKNGTYAVTTLKTDSSETPLTNLLNYVNAHEIRGAKQNIVNASSKTISGTVFDDVIAPLGANQTVNAGKGNDKIFADSGNDTLIGGLGTNEIVYEYLKEPSELFPQKSFGKDIIKLTKGETLNLNIKYDDESNVDLTYSHGTGKNANDLIITNNAKAGDSITIKDYYGKATGATVLINGTSLLTTKQFDFNKDNIKNATLTGSALADSIDATGAGLQYVTQKVKGKTKKVLTNLKINAGEGKNEITGSVYNDTITAGSGNDIAYATTGNDSYKLGSGWDNIYYNGEDNAFGNDTIYLTKGQTLNIRFDYNIEDESENIDYKRSGNDCVLTTKNGTVTFKNYYAKDMDAIANIIYKKGTSNKVFDPRGMNRLFEFDHTNLKKGALTTSALSDKIDMRNMTKPVKTVKGVKYGATINAGGGSDLVYGSAFNDTINGGEGGNYLYGEGGDDTIIGGNSRDFLVGGDGNDKIYAKGGTDDLSGGKGNDILSGGAGNDTFMFTVGDGVDTITDATKDDIIEISGTTLGSLRYAKNGNNLEIYYNDTYDQNNKIIVQNHFKTAEADRLTKVRVNYSSIADLSTMDFTTYTGTGKITADNADNLILGSNKADTIYALGGNDEIKPGLGKDAIKGGSGTTTIKYNTLDELAGDKIYLTKGEKLTIEVPLTGIVNNNYNNEYTGLTYRVSGKDLVVNVNDGTKTASFTLVGFAEKNITENRIKIKGTDSSYQELYEGYFKATSSNGTWLSDIIDHSKSKKAVKIDGKGGTDIITGSKYGDTIYAGSSITKVTGGKGNDKLYGGPGQYDQTTYYFNKGDGKDTIYCNKGKNYLEFTNATDLKVTKSKRDIIISYNFVKGKAKDTVTIKNYYNAKGQVAGNVQSISFAGYSFTVDELLGKKAIISTDAEINGTNNNDFIIASENQIINAGAGNDIIYSNSTNNITSGAGNNTIVIKALADQIINPTEGENLTLQVDVNALQWAFAANGDDIDVKGSISGVYKKFTIKGAMLEENKDKYNITINYAGKSVNLNDVQVVNSVPTWRNDRISKGTSEVAVTIADSKGNDYISGSNHDDTLNGGIGNDELSGGKGSDTYNVSSLETLTTINEQDGYHKNISDGDVLNIDAAKNDMHILFNVKKDGTFADSDNHLFIVNEETFGHWSTTGEYPTSGVKIQHLYNSVETINSNDGYRINRLEELKDDVAAWLTNANNGNGYADVASAIKSGDDVSELIAIFERPKNWANTIIQETGTIYGDNNDNILIATGTSSQYIYGRKGDDTLIASNNCTGDSLDGDYGNDILYGSNYNGANVNVGQCNMYGGEGDDIFYAGEYCAKYLYLGRGNDTVYTSTDAKNNLGNYALNQIFVDSNGTLSDAGQDTIYWQGSESVQVFIGGVDKSEVQLTRNANDNDLTLRYGADNSVTFKDYYKSGNEKMATVIDIHTKNNTQNNTLSGLLEAQGGVKVKINGFDGTDANDFIEGTDEAETIHGGAGNDVIRPMGGNDIIYLGAGDDYVIAGDGANTVYAESGNNIINLGKNNDTVYAGSGSDSISLGKGSNTIYFSYDDTADDYYKWSTGGNDTLVFADDSFDNMTLDSRDGTVLTRGNGTKLTFGPLGSYSVGFWLSDGTNTTRLSDISRYAGSPDSIYALNLTTGQGNDHVYLTGHNDTVNLGTGTNTLYLNITATGNNNTYTYGNGTDTFMLPDGSADLSTVSTLKNENDLIVGYNNSVINNTVRIKNYFLNTGMGDNITLKSIGETKTLNQFLAIHPYDEPIICDGTNHTIDKSGESKAVDITGCDEADTITGTAYGDTINGKGGADRLMGGAGNDIYTIDTADYGDGQDVISDASGTDDKLLLGATSSEVNLFFDVNAAGTVTDGLADYTLGNDLYISKNNEFTISNAQSTADLKIENYFTTGKIEHIRNLADSADLINPQIIRAVGQTVANWLQKNGYASTSEVITSGSDEEKAQLTALYKPWLNSNYRYNLSGAVDNYVILNGTSGQGAYAGNGNDIIFANDSLVESYITGGGGDDILYGSNYNSSEDVNVGHGELSTGAGNDTVFAGEYCAKYIRLGNGNDTVYTSSGELNAKNNYAMNQIWIDKDATGYNGGHDTIHWRGTQALTLHFYNYNNKELAFTRNGESNDLVIRYGNDNSVTMKDYFKSGNEALADTYITHTQNRAGTSLGSLITNSVYQNGIMDYTETDIFSYDGNNENNYIVANTSVGGVNAGGGNDYVVMKGFGTVYTNNNITDGKDTTPYSYDQVRLTGGAGHTVYAQTETNIITSSAVGGSNDNYFAYIDQATYINDNGGTDALTITNTNETTDGAKSNLTVLFDVKANYTYDENNLSKVGDIFVTSDTSKLNFNRFKDRIMYNFDGVCIKDNQVETISSSDGFTLTNNEIASLAQDVAGWLADNGYANVNDVFNNALNKADNNSADITSIIAKFNTANWTPAA